MDEKMRTGVAMNPKGTIEGTLNIALDNLSLLHNGIGNLEERLKPILEPQVPSPVAPDSEPPLQPTDSTVLTAVQRISREVSDMVTRLERIENRVQI